MGIRRWRWTGATLLVLVALGTDPAGAGRPFDTVDTGTVEPGKAELELSGDFARNPEDRAWLAKGVLNLGVVPRLETRIESTFLSLEPDDGRRRGGIGDSLVGLKYRLPDEADAIPAVLGALAVRLPTGDEDRELGAGEVDVGVLAVAGKTLGPVTLTWNGGYTFVTRDRELEVLDPGGGRRVPRHRRVVAARRSHEPPAQSPGPGDGRPPGRHHVCAPSESRPDTAVGFGVTRQSPDVLVTFGVTIALF